MKNNYPIKYAVMPIYEQTGWNHGINELVRNFEVVAYIVSKCYVISEKKEYLRNGKEKINYQVVFPYSNSCSNYYDEYRRIEPEYNANYECTDITVVDNIFNTYEEANQVAENLNKEIFTKKSSYLSFKEYQEKRNELIKTHNKTLEIYKELEKEIIENTQDLELDLPNKEQTIIVVKDGKRKIINESLYQYINFISYYPFTVFNVSEEEYELMKKQIKNNEKIDKHNSNCLMISDTEKIDIINYNDNNSKQFSLISEYGSMYMKKQENIDNNIEIREGIIIYTIETYEDIINSFMCHDNIEVKRKVKSN